MSGGTGAARPRRPTIADVAQRAGVTKAAVSFALNGQPGVSAATRERIIAIAAEVGFQPSSAARALSDGRAGAFGLVIDRPARFLGIEPYFMQLIAGIQTELSQRRVTLLFTTAEDQAAEIEMYRSWWAQRRVDGVFLVDLQLDDRRVAVLEKLNMPAVVVGSPLGSGSLPAIWRDDVAPTRTVLGHLAGLGHRRIGRVNGFARYWHVRQRTDAFVQIAADAGMEAVCVEADYTSEHGADATRELLGGASPPTAILYDNDLMAVSGLSAAQRMGVDVPAGLSIVAWDDSLLCELVHPAITALHRDIAAVGAEAARRLDQAAAGVPVGNFQETPPVLTVRDSTGPAPGGGSPPSARARPPRSPRAARTAGT
ncbi:MAG: LacI family DNA-binding transcriptional regulator [Streptosporangiaceae bacterium]|nr:LacI family DNA-binding transcriptional regulator [Streptosporangiaceae bacterium]MBV9858031.1 LacI family DNA-binding transcriptional regulator [Streptosporangiaceae bacterium]